MFLKVILIQSSNLLNQNIKNHENVNHLKLLIANEIVGAYAIVVLEEEKTVN